MWPRVLRNYPKALQLRFNCVFLGGAAAPSGGTAFSRITTKALETMKRINRTPHRIAIFGKDKRLCGLSHSMTYTAKMLEVKTPAVHFACKGAVVACQGFYFREVINAEIGIDDLGKLRLEDFDKVNTPGVEFVTLREKDMRKRRAAK